MSRSPRWSVNYIAPDDASPLNEPGEKPSVCVLPARKGQTHSALASYVGSLFPETNCEFVQSYECEVMSKVDQAWPDGPWNNEPDHVEFETDGVPCILHRNRFGTWCGYAAVPPGHPAHGKGWSDVDVRVHGGITYADSCNGTVCHVPKPGEPDDVWWLGFDCGHSSDQSPRMLMLDAQLGFRGFSSWGTYRTVDYARAQTEGLARQLKAMAP